MIGYAIAGLCVLAAWVGMVIVCALGFGRIVRNRNRHG